MNKAPILGFLLVLCLIYSAEAQNPVSAFGDNLRSGALSEAIGNLVKNTVLLPYTTVGKELNPEYDAQRKIVDGIIFFVIFFIVVRMSINNMWKDMEKKQRNLLSFAVAIALTIGILSSGFSFGKIVPYGINILTILMVPLFIFLIQMPKNRENKPYIGFLPALLAAIMLSWLIVNTFNLAEGKSPSLLGGVFDTERKSEFSPRLVAGGGTIETNNPETNYKLAIEAIQNYEYDKAKTYFEKIIRFGASGNPYFATATKYISRDQGDKLFILIAEHYPAIMSAERSAAEHLIDQVREIAADDPDIKRRSKRIELLEQAQAYINDVKKKESFLTEQFKLREVQ